MVEVRIFFALFVAAAAACAVRGLPSHLPTEDTFPGEFSFAAEIVVPATPSRSALPASRVGGLSGIVPLRDGRELLAISDDHENSRVVRLRVAPGPAWAVEPAAVITLEKGTGAPSRLDPEGIALTEEGHILVVSEGIGDPEPRLPPAIIEYSPGGRFIRQLPMRPRYSPTPRGALVNGVRGNAGLESLTTSPDFSQLFTAGEHPLVQDGEAYPFSRSAPSRILEYVRGGGAYQPRREFAYEVEPLVKPPYPVGFAVNGLVELLAIGPTELLALERGFVEAVDRSASLNRIRIFRITLDGASDISHLDTLRGARGIVPVRKRLVADLNRLGGLSPALRNLDNFEGLAWGPAGADGVRPLIVVSDDNFNDRQVTAFLFLRPGQR